jgi:multicomponent Na+:H+ antiporter subunit E
MSAFLLNLLLAVLWAALIGTIDLANLGVGFVLGYGVLWLLRPLVGGRYHRKLPQAIGFALFFFKELVVSTVRVAWEVLTPATYRKPGIVAVPLDAETDLEITLLANVITLTPGTLSLEVSEDRSILYVHAMFVDDAEALRRDLKEGFERRVLELLR